MTDTQIKTLIQTGEATNSVCTETRKPIFLNDNYYLLAHNRYADDCDIDRIITDVTKGEFTNAHELYESCNPEDGRGDTDYFYNTTLEDFDEIFEEIMDEKRFYNKKGEVVTFK